MSITFDEYVGGVVKHLRTPADSINEDDLLAWLEQRWYGRPANGWKITVCRKHAEAYDRHVADGFGRPGSNGRTDRGRRISTRNAG